MKLSSYKTRCLCAGQKHPGVHHSLSNRYSRTSTNYSGARSMICKIDRDELMQVLVQEYLFQRN